MTELEKALSDRFGAHRVNSLEPKKKGDIELLKIDLELRSPVTVIMTNGLSNYEMPVPEKFSKRAFNELYFCLPSYWELDSEEERFQWPLDWIKKLGKHLIDKKTWYGPGHTFSNGEPSKAFSSTMKSNHLILVDPIFLEEHLQPLALPDKTIHFLAIVPLFENEFDYKMSKGYFKFIRKFRVKNNDELLDDFRESNMKLKFRIF